jgi:hypothetical protein
MPKLLETTTLRGKKRRVYEFTDNIEEARKIAKKALANGEITPIFLTEDGQRLRVEAKSKQKLDGPVSWKDIDVKTVERGETSAKRKMAIEKLSPDPTVQRAGQEAMAAANKAGLEGHHGLPLEKAQRGYDEILETKGKAAADEWIRTQAAVGKPLGHDPANIFALGREEHSAIHAKLEPQLQESIKKAGSEADKVFSFANGGVRLNARNLAVAGLLSYGAFGTAASAAETAQRAQLAQETGNPLDMLQAGIAGVSTAADVAAYNPLTSLPAEAVSTAADVANIGIDAARSINIGNELKYIGGQVRLGRLPYGLEQVASWAKSAF